MTQARARTRRQRSDARQSIAAVIDAAIRTLGDRPDASMDEIARAAGVTRQTVYAHFPSRDALIDAVVEAVDPDAGTLVLRTIADAAPILVWNGAGAAREVEPGTPVAVPLVGPAAPAAGWATVASLSSRSCLAIAPPRSGLHDRHVDARAGSGGNGSGEDRYRTATWPRPRPSPSRCWPRRSSAWASRHG